MLSCEGMTRKKFIVSFVILLIFGYYFWLLFLSGDFFYTHGRNAQNRVALLKIREEIHLGAGYETVLKVYWRNASSDLRLSAGRPDGWSISMPSEIFTTDWGLRIDFSDGKVSAMSIRNADGLHPPDAPEDIGDK